VKDIVRLSRALRCLERLTVERVSPAIEIETIPKRAPSDVSGLRTLVA
jgi:hypothetical protein